MPKYFLYEVHGAKEYWLIIPSERSVIIFTRDDNGAFQSGKPLTRGDLATSNVLPGLTIDLDEVFRDLIQEPEEGYGVEMKRV